MVSRQEFQSVTYRVRKLLRHQARTDLPSPIVEMSSAWNMELAGCFTCFAFIVCFQHRDPNNQHLRTLNNLRNFLSFMLQRDRAVNTAASGWRKERHQALRRVSINLLKRLEGLQGLSLEERFDLEV
jgi:hypothetical protein